MKSEGDSPTSEPHPKLRWQAIGRFAAAVSVILSLVFVGWEIRQNNAVARMTASQAFTQQLLDLTPILLADPFASLNRRVVAGERRADFDEAERAELDIPLMGLLRVWESLYRAVEVDVTDPEMLDGLGDGPGPFRTEYFRDSWPYYRQSYTDDFIDFVEDALGLKPTE